MKNVPVKFRGVSKGESKNVYGIGVKDYGDGRVDIIKDDMTRIAVTANSVAQLMGYDADGNEVYEGERVYTTLTSNFIEATLQMKVPLHKFRKV